MAHIVGLQVSVICQTVFAGLTGLLDNTVTGSDILSLVEVRCHQLEMWSESDVIKFQHLVIKFPRIDS